MTTEHQLEEEGFTAPTDAVTIVLSTERYNQLVGLLEQLASREAAELLCIIDMEASTFNE